MCVCVAGALRRKNPEACLQLWLRGSITQRRRRQGQPDAHKRAATPLRAAAGFGDTGSGRQTPYHPYGSHPGQRRRRPRSPNPLPSHFAPSRFAAHSAPSFSVAPLSPSLKPSRPPPLPQAAHPSHPLHLHLQLHKHKTAYNNKFPHATMPRRPGR